MCKQRAGGKNLTALTPLDRTMYYIVKYTILISIFGSSISY